MVENPFYGSVEIGEFLKKLVKRSEGKWFFFNKKIDAESTVYCIIYVFKNKRKKIIISYPILH